MYSFTVHSKPEYATIEYGYQVRVVVESKIRVRTVTNGSLLAWLHLHGNSCCKPGLKEAMSMFSFQL